MDWTYNIKIKHMFDDEIYSKPKDEQFKHTADICNVLIRQLDSLYSAILKSKITEGEYIAEFELEPIIENFRYCQEIANGIIPKDSWDDYCFNGDVVALFNEYLAELYDLADQRVKLLSGVTKKLLWIG